jgi:hypothetical protein
MKKTNHKGRKRSQRRQSCRPAFRLFDNGLPIAGLPEPRPCPFCGSTDINIDLKHEDANDVASRWCAEAWCSGCGCQAGAAANDEHLEAGDDGPVIGVQYRIVATTAFRWNRRDRRGAVR